MSFFELSGVLRNPEAPGAFACPPARIFPSARERWIGALPHPCHSMPLLAVIIYRSKLPVLGTYLAWYFLFCIFPALANHLASWGPPSTSQLGMRAGTGDVEAFLFLRKPSCEGEGPWERSERNVSPGGEWAILLYLVPRPSGPLSDLQTKPGPWPGAVGSQAGTMGGRRKQGDKAQGPGVYA